MFFEEQWNKRIHFFHGLKNPSLVLNKGKTDILSIMDSLETSRGAFMAL